MSLRQDIYCAAHVLMAVYGEEAGIDAAAHAARRAGVRLRVLVEVDVGQGRCGVEPGLRGAGRAGLGARGGGRRHGR